MSDPIVMPLEAADLDSISLVGGKSASLGEMIINLSKLGVAVPGGFAVTTNAYFGFIKKSGLEQLIKEQLDSIDFKDLVTLRRAGQKIRQAISSTRFPPELSKEIIDAYLELSKKYKNFKFYEIPVLSSGIKWLSSFIDGGMRSGIPDKNIREHTITAYISKDDFLKNLSITNENDIHVYLLDEKGVIVWKSEGNFNDKNKEELEKLIN